MGGKISPRGLPILSGYPNIGLGILVFAYIRGDTFMADAARIMQETIEKAAPLFGKREYAGVVSSAGTKLIQAIAKDDKAVLKKNKLGAPPKLTKSIEKEILRRIENGETLNSITESLELNIATIYYWIDKDENFSKCYNRSKSLMAKTLVEKLVDETSTLSNDQALAARVRADVIKWLAARYAPAEFGEVKRLELKGEVTHTHIHELPDHQKRKIAEAWLMSQADDTPGITAETTGPDLEGVAVREICEEAQGIIPKHKRSASDLPALPAPAGDKRKRGRPRKHIDLDHPIDRQDDPG